MKSKYRNLGSLLESALVIKSYLFTQNAKTPKKKYDADAGFDLYSPTSYVLAPGENITIDFECSFNLPEGYYGLLLGRSSLNTQYLLTYTGVIDANYTGTIKGAFSNLGNETIKIETGERIAQIVVVTNEYLPLVLSTREKTDPRRDNVRGDNGFGSSGA